jgi:hypothetical protein
LEDAKNSKELVMKTIIAGLLIILGSLTACQNTPAGQETPTTPSAPGVARPDPTSTPSPVAPAETPTPTSVVSDLVATQTYTHTTQRFRIDYPGNWQSVERSDGVIFIDPGDQAGYSVFFSDVGEPYSTEHLNQYLETFVVQNFADATIDSQETLPDESVLAQFTTEDPTLGQTINEVRVLQEDTLVFILLMSIIEPQWKISKDRLHTLAQTLTPLDTSPAANAEPTEEAPVWTLTGPTSNKFAFFYPSDWEIITQEENSVTVRMPDTNIVFETSTFAWPGADSDPESAQKAAEAFVTSLDKKHQQVEVLPPAEFPLDTMTGITIDFLYTTEADESMAGSVITAANEGQMYRVVFLAPAEYYQGALEWFNPMYKSFRILSPEELEIDPDTAN